MADSSTINWQQLLPAFASLISGGLDIGQRNSISGMGNSLADIADPFRGQRGQYQTGMASLINGPNPVMDFLKDPSATTSMPGYQEGMGAGIDAVNRAAGSRGMAASGNRMTDLFKFGRQFDMNAQNQLFSQLVAGRNQQFSELLPLTGATTGSPGAGALAAAQGTQQTQGNQGSGIAALSGGIGSLLNSIPGLSKLFSGLTDGSISSSDLQNLFTNPGNDDWSGWLTANGGGSATDLSNLFSGAGNPDDMSGWMNNIDLSSIFGP